MRLGLDDVRLSDQAASLSNHHAEHAMAAGTCGASAMGINAVDAGTTVYQKEWMTQLTAEAILTDPPRMAQGIMTGIRFFWA